MLFNILDSLSILFWTATYILAIAYGIYHKRHAIPLIAIFLNLSWETMALLKVHMWGHYLWFLLDLIIALLVLFYDKSITRKKKIALLVFECCMLLIMPNIFLMKSGVLISSFLLNLVMSFLFILELEKMYVNKIAIAISICKLIGSFSAWVAYRYNNVAVVVGALYIILDCIYCYLLWKKFVYKKENKHEL